MSDYGLFSQCPHCEKVYREIARHWKQSSCDYPQLSKEQREIITGSLMGDGHLDKRNKNPIVKWTMTSKEYLKYLSKEKFPLLSLEVNQMSKEKQHHSEMFGLWTRALPELKDFNYWYQGKNNKIFPKDISLTPKAFKHWYVQDGNFYHNSIKITCCKEIENTDKLNKIFSGSEIPNPYKFDKRKTTFDGKQFPLMDICWNTTQTAKIFGMIGEPLPGFEYKWGSYTIDR